MEILSKQNIKVILTIIAKTTVLSILLINLSCNNMSNQKFKVFGDEVLLKDCKINIFTTDETGFKKANTLLYNGKIFDVKSSEEMGEVYTIYVSYKDSLVNTLEFENIFRNAKDQVNNFYIDKNKNIITIKFIGRESDLKNGQGSEAIFIPWEDYLKTNSIAKEKIKENKEVFFDLF